MSPRPPVDRVARSIRLRKEIDEALVATAKKYGLSVNAYIEQLISGEGWASPVGFLAPNDDFVSEDFPEGFRAANCKHPKSARQVFSWGSKCGDCGKRL